MASKKRFKSYQQDNCSDKEEIKLTPDRKSNDQYINWFPGHMNKAVKEIKSKLKLIDLVLEIRDARVPEISKNDELEKAIGKKPKIIIFNKSNLADPRTTKKWINYYEVKSNHDSSRHIFTNALDISSCKQILTQIKDFLSKNYQNENPDGERKKKISIMIIGLPNTGKSTLINRLSGRNATRTANKPGYTQTQQWIKIDSQTELLDTPGIMPPKIHSLEAGLKLCAIYAIPNKIVPDETTAIFLLNFISTTYPDSIQKRYGISPITMNTLTLLEEIGLKRNCLLKNAQVDYEKVYGLILNDFREGKLGKISLESPPIVYV